MQCVCVCECVRMCVCLSVCPSICLPQKLCMSGKTVRSSMFSRSPIQASDICRQQTLVSDQNRFQEPLQRPNSGSLCHLHNVTVAAVDLQTSPHILSVTYTHSNTHAHFYDSHPCIVERYMTRKKTSANDQCGQFLLFLCFGSVIVTWLDTACRELPLSPWQSSSVS